jgi:hypothetical protein
MWEYNGQEFTEDLIGKSIGFIYLITNLTNGRRYIGKKQFYSFTSSIKTVTLKSGEKKKKKVKKISESNWKDYYSSSIELNGDVELLGKDMFKREILYLVSTKGMMSYMEAKLQFQHEVLEHPDLWYNGTIQCRIHKSHVKML